MRRRIRRRSYRTAALLLVAVIGLCCALIYRPEQKKIREVSRRAMYYNRELTELRASERGLEEQLQALEAEKLQLSGGITAGILCTEPNPRILTDILPRMEKAGYPGMVAIRTDALPNDPGCLTLGEIYTLIGKGWTVCLSVTDSTDAEALYRTASDLGLTPMAAYFPENGCTAEAEKRLAALGITVLMQRSVYEPQIGAYIQTCGSNSSGVQDMLLAAISDDRDFVLTIGYHREEELFEESECDAMLAVLERYRNEQWLCVDTADVAAAERLLKEQELAEAAIVLGETHESIRKSLEDVRMRIHSIGQNP